MQQALQQVCVQDAMIQGSTIEWHQLAQRRGEMLLVFAWAA
jgi:hypothetical protein